MNSSKILKFGREEVRKSQFFLDWGLTLGIDPKEQIKGEAEGLRKAPKLWSRRFQDTRMRLAEADNGQESHSKYCTL
jgi:hypothetical protein